MNNTKIRNKLPALSVFVFIFTILMLFCVSAQEMGDIMSSYVGKDSISLYVQGKSDMKVTAQIGTKEIKDVDVVPLSDTEKIETLILVDNSLSTTEESRPIITELLTGVVGNKLPNESISVATFSKNIEYKVNDTTDYTQLKNAIDSLEYKYQDAYLLPVLYDLSKEYATKEENIFRRVIIVSDGASDEEIGVKVSELLAQLNKNSFPIYTFGCKSEDGSNNGDLENLYSIARTTGAEYWTVNDINNPDEISSQFSKRLVDIDRVDIKVPKSLQDGSEKGVKILMMNGGLSLDASTTVNMPFGSSQKDKSLPFIIIIVIAVLIILLLIILIVNLVKKKDDGYQQVLDDLQNKEKSRSNSQMQAENVQRQNTPAPINRDKRNVRDRVYAVSSNTPNNYEADIQKTPETPQRREDDNIIENDNFSRADTKPCNVGQREKVPTIVIEAMGRSWEINISKPILIGRGEDLDIQLRDRTVSKKHCMIYYENGNVYIKDLKSSNHTFIGRQDITETGSYLIKVNMLKMRLGDVDVIVEVRR
jgi:von willebrand factor type A domain